MQGQASKPREPSQSQVCAPCLCVQAPRAVFLPGFKGRVCGEDSRFMSAVPAAASPDGGFPVPEVREAPPTWRVPGPAPDRPLASWLVGPSLSLPSSSAVVGLGAPPSSHRPGRLPAEALCVSRSALLALRGPGTCPPPTPDGRCWGPAPSGAGCASVLAFPTC